MKRPEGMSYERYCEERKKQKRQEKIQRAGVFITGPFKGCPVYVANQLQADRVGGIANALFGRGRR